MNVKLEYMLHCFCQSCSQCSKYKNNMENNMRNTLVHCLKQQLSEFELLKSMYPSEEEIILTDKTTLHEIEKFIYIKSEYSPNHLDFILNLSINSLKLELYINLPNLYPEEEPDLYVRCNLLNRYQESSLNKKLSQFIKDNHTREVCLYNAISWLQDNIDNFREEVTIIEVEQRNTEKDQKFVRFWIYSHHIYNKKKREVILAQAKVLKITGFCLPGKPGIICVEGPESICLEWWKDIKSLSWKKITIRKTEIFDINEQELHQKFSKFEELHFKNPSFSKHANLSEFSKYIQKYNLLQAFNEFFGLCTDI